MKTTLMWDDSVGDRELPNLPEGMGNFDCERLKVGDNLTLAIEGYCDEADIIVTKVGIDFIFTPMAKRPFAKKCECIQWVEVKPDWDETEDEIPEPQTVEEQIAGLTKTNIIKIANTVP